MSESRVFAEICTAVQAGKATENLWSVAPYQCGGGAILLVAPQLSDTVLTQIQTLLREFSPQNYQVVHAAERDQHQALIIAADTLPSRTQLREWSDHLHIDVGAREHPQAWRWPRLSVFDMDSTLITMEVIDELAKEAGVGEQVAAITEAAMRGELDFNASLTQRVATLKDLPLIVIERVRSRLQFNPGVPEFAAAARQQHCRLALVSGGFIPFAEWVKSSLQFDFARANTLAMAQEKLTGEVLGEIVNAAVKARTLSELAQQYNLSLLDVMAVGDGANDLLMLQASGFGVAFRAKPKLRAAADLALDVSDMRALNALFK